ncbi:MAG: RsmD family RNA methyltransferase [Acidimicrobiales bacterium]
MRVVGGSARGRKLIAPAGGAIRPTSDRVREAVFNMLASRGAPQGQVVLDLFSGSGAMGIEALSRGASQVFLVDSDPQAVQTIRANLASTGLVPLDLPSGGSALAQPVPQRAFASPRPFEVGAQVVLAEAVSWVTRSPLAAGADLVMCDPPYSFVDWDLLLAPLSAPLVVVESDRAVTAPLSWEVLVQRHYGTTVVTLFSTAPPISTKGGW